MNNEPSVYVKGGACLDQLNGRYLLSKDCTLWSYLVKLLHVLMKREAAIIGASAWKSVRGNEYSAMIFSSKAVNNRAEHFHMFSL